MLEYLWDFSFSRYAIPQAIETSKAKGMGNGKFELLLVAESEMGTKDGICRDRLKLLEARTTYAVSFTGNLGDPGIWLFVALKWAHQKIECDLYTLDRKLNALTAVATA